MLVLACCHILPNSRELTVNVVWQLKAKQRALTQTHTPTVIMILRLLFEDNAMPPKVWSRDVHGHPACAHMCHPCMVAQPRCQESSGKRARKRHGVIICCQHGDESMGDEQSNSCQRFLASGTCHEGCCGTAPQHHLCAGPTMAPAHQQRRQNQLCDGLIQLIVFHGQFCPSIGNGNAPRHPAVRRPYTGWQRYCSQQARYPTMNRRKD